MNTATVSRGKTYDIVYIGIFAVLLAVCSWISLPFAVPFTLQTFGVFMTLETLGGKRGTMAILVFLLMGLVGLPVFSGFRGGPGCLPEPQEGILLDLFSRASGMGNGKLLGEKWKNQWYVYASCCLASSCAMLLEPCGFSRCIQQQWSRRHRSRSGMVRLSLCAAGSREAWAGFLFWRGG